MGEALGGGPEGSPRRRRRVLGEGEHQLRYPVVELHLPRTPAAHPRQVSRRRVASGEPRTPRALQPPWLRGQKRTCATVTQEREEMFLENNRLQALRRARGGGGPRRSCGPRQCSPGLWRSRLRSARARRAPAAPARCCRRPSAPSTGTCGPPRPPPPFRSSASDDTAARLRRLFMAGGGRRCLRMTAVGEQAGCVPACNARWAPADDTAHSYNAARLGSWPFVPPWGSQH